MNKRDRDALETIDLNAMDQVSGGCNQCTGSAPAGGTANTSGAARQPRSAAPRS